MKILIIALISMFIGGCTTTQPDSDNHLLKITQTAPTYYIMQNSSKWRDLENYIVSTNAKTIVINFNGGGGNVNMGWNFIDAIKTAQKQGKTIIINVSHVAASMHAITACYADILTGGGELMFHSVGYSAHKTQYRDVEGARDYLYMFQGCFDKGIVSKAEVETMLTGKELHVRLSTGEHYFSRDPRPVAGE